MKKAAFLVFQISLFLFEFANGRAKFGIKIVKTGWPGSNWQSRFLTIGTVRFEEQRIYTKLGDKVYPLRESPQREFFEAMDSKSDLKRTHYFEHAKDNLSPADFDFWSRTKLQLWKKFDPKDVGFTAVGVMNHRRNLIVEDGAHRLALKSLYAPGPSDVSISLWTLNQRL